MQTRMVVLRPPGASGRASVSVPVRRFACLSASVCRSLPLPLSLSLSFSFSWVRSGRRVALSPLFGSVGLSFSPLFWCSLAALG